MHNVVWLHHVREPDAFRAVWEWASVRVWGKPTPAPQGTAAAVFLDGTMVAAMVFEGYNRDARVIELTGAADTARWLTRGILTDLWAYVDQMGADTLVMKTDAENTRVRRIAKHMGGQEYPVPRLRGKDKTTIFCVIPVEAWRATGLERAAK